MVKNKRSGGVPWVGTCCYELPLRNVLKVNGLVALLTPQTRHGWQAVENDLGTASWQRQLYDSTPSCLTPEGLTQLLPLSSVTVSIPLL